MQYKTQPNLLQAD